MSMKIVIKKIFMSMNNYIKTSKNGFGHKLTGTLWSQVVCKQVYSRLCIDYGSHKTVTEPSYHGLTFDLIADAEKYIRVWLSSNKIYEI